MITHIDVEISKNILAEHARMRSSICFDNMDTINSNATIHSHAVPSNANWALENDCYVCNCYENAANINGKIFTGKTKERSTVKTEYNSAKAKNENAILISQKNKKIPKCH